MSTVFVEIQFHILLPSVKGKYTIHIILPSLRAEHIYFRKLIKTQILVISST